MGLTQSNEIAIAFKKLSGKSHTQQAFAASEEGITTNVQSSYNTVFGSPIEPLPVTNSGLTTLYSTNGKVQRIKFQVDIIPNTQIGVNQSQGYRLKLPADWNTHPGALYPQFSAGTYLHTALGKLQIVPSLYGKLKTDGSTEYDPILYQTNGSTIITKFDSINWSFDPYSGILFVQDPPSGFDISANRPGYVEAFLFVGDYLNDVVFNVVSGITGTTGINVGIGADVFKDKLGSDLRFRRIFGNNGILVTGTTNNILVSYTGTSGAANGLSVVGKNAVLGGALTGNTFINLNNHQLTISGASSSALTFAANGGIYFPDPTGGGIFFDDLGGGGVYFNDKSGGGIQIGSSTFTGGGVSINGRNSSSIGLSIYHNNTNKFSLSLSDSSGAKFIDNRTGGTAHGIEYNANYSANYSARSLVDYATVTGKTSVANNNFVFGTGTGIGAHTSQYTGDESVFVVMTQTPPTISGNSGINNVFVLGEAAFLYGSPSQGGTITDSVVFGFGNTLGDGVSFFGGSGTLTYGSFNVNAGNSSLVGGVNARVKADIPFGGLNDEGAVAIGLTTILSGSELVTAYRNTVNISSNTTGQTSGHGAYGSLSVILGGQDHDIPLTSPRSAILGGNKIKAVSGVSDTVYLPKVRIGQGIGGSLTVNNSNTNLLGKNSVSGEIEIIHISGSSFSNNGVVITVTAYTATTNTSFVGVSGNTASVIYLPTTPTAYKSYIISDIKGNAGTANITINGNGKLIIGSTTALIDSNYGSITFMYNTFNWSIIASN